MSRRKAILVVEDEIDSAEMMAVLLSGAGYDVTYAQNGKDALAKLADITPDLIMTDLMMPFMSGDELIRTVRKDPRFRKTPVILLTAGGDPSTVARLKTHFMAKPIDIQALLELAAELLK